MTGEKKCYITQIEYLIKNGLVGMDTLDSEAKVYIFYKKEDMIPVDLHVEIHKKVSAQLEYLKADTDSEKYLMLGMLIGKNADSAEYVIVSNEFDLPEAFREVAGTVEQCKDFQGSAARTKAQRKPVKRKTKENTAKENTEDSEKKEVPEQQKKIKKETQISEDEPKRTEEKSVDVSDKEPEKHKKNIVNKRTLEDDYTYILNFLDISRDKLTCGLPNRMIAQKIVDIYSDLTEDIIISNALESVFGSKDKDTILAAVATKKANLVMKAKEITKKINHGEYN